MRKHLKTNDIHLITFAFSLLHIRKVWTPLDCHGRTGLQRGIRRREKGTNRRLVQVWNTKRGAYKKALKWLHMRAKFFGQRLSSFLLRRHPTNMSKGLVNRKCGERKSERFGNEPAPGRPRSHLSKAISLTFLIISSHLFSRLLHRRLGVQFVCVRYCNSFKKEREICTYVKCTYVYTYIENNFSLFNFNFTSLTLYYINPSVNA